MHHASVTADNGYIKTTMHINPARPNQSGPKNLGLCSCTQNPGNEENSMHESDGMTRFGVLCCWCFIDLANNIFMNYVK